MEALLGALLDPHLTGEGGGLVMASQLWSVSKGEERRAAKSQRLGLQGHLIFHTAPLECTSEALISLCSNLTTPHAMHTL